MEDQKSNFNGLILLIVHIFRLLVFYFCAFQVEVHDLASLAPLQTLDLSGATCMTTCPAGGGRGDLTYVATTSSVNLLKLIPIEFQVSTRAEDQNSGAGHY